MSLHHLPLNQRHGGIASAEAEQADLEKAEKSIKEFERKLNNAENGILHLDAKSDYAKITRDIKLVDPDTIRFIDEKILRTFGVPLSILTGDYTKRQYEA